MKVRILLVIIIVFASITANAGYRELVVSEYQKHYEERFMKASVSAQGNTLQISIIRLDKDRCNELMDYTLYKAAKKAKFKKILFVDINGVECSMPVK